MPVDEWKEMDAAAKAMDQKRLDRSFREDYEIGVYGETFQIVYSGGCDECGLSHSFKHERPVAEVRK